MSEKYYIFKLDEPGAPSFCSFDKIYVGTEKTIKQVARNLKKTKRYPETVKAIRDYFNGNHEAEHQGAYVNEKVLVPVEIISEHENSLENKKWTHLNIWRFPYEMKCDSVRVHQIVFKNEGRIYRCARAWLKNLSFKGVSENWNKLDGGFWGNDFVLDIIKEKESDDFTFNNLLYIVEEVYDNKKFKTVIKDMLNDSKVELKYICDEIFGDG